MTDEQIEPAVSGLHPGRLVDHAQFRRHRARPDHHPAFLRHAGRLDRREEHAGPGFDLHHSAAGSARETGQADDDCDSDRAGERRACARRDQVLVVDDDPAVHDVLAATLGKEGYRITHARDGMEALNIMRANPPDIVTLDVMMPKMDGWSVLGVMKSEAAARAHPGDHAHHRRRPQSRILARRRRIHDQADRPQPADRADPEVRRRPKRTAWCWWSTMIPMCAAMVKTHDRKRRHAGRRGRQRTGGARLARRKPASPRSSCWT